MTVQRINRVAVCNPPAPMTVSERLPPTLYLQVVFQALPASSSSEGIFLAVRTVDGIFRILLIRGVAVVPISLLLV